MTAITQSRSGGFGWILLLAALGFLALASLALEVDSMTATTAPSQPVVAPPLEPGAHALERHGADAQTIFDRYDDGDFTCMRAYYTTQSGGKMLYRFSYRDLTVEGGIVATMQGTTITAFLAPSMYWDRVVARDSYARLYTIGTCAKRE